MKMYFPQSVTLVKGLLTFSFRQDSKCGNKSSYSTLPNQTKIHRRFPRFNPSRIHFCSNISTHLTRICLKSSPIERESDGEILQLNLSVPAITLFYSHSVQFSVTLQEIPLGRNSLSKLPLEQFQTPTRRNK